MAAEDREKFEQYAHPEKLVSTDWLAEHLGEPGLVVVETDEDVLLYDTGHIPGAVKVGTPSSTIPSSGTTAILRPLPS